MVPGLSQGHAGLSHDLGAGFAFQDFRKSRKGRPTGPPFSARNGLPRKEAQATNPACGWTWLVALNP